MVRVLQIATVGEDVEPVMVGIREYPVTKLVLVHTKQTASIARDIREKLAFLRLDTELHEVGAKDTLMDTMSVVGEIVARERGKYDDIIINVSSGDKMQTCSALSAAFVNGVKAIGIRDNHPFLLPVLKFSYRELISEPKLEVLRALEKMGGSAESLQDLSEASGVEKSLLSYHIRGSRDGKGLEELGLVEVDRAQQGRLVVKVTEMGRLMLLAGREAPAKT